MGVWAARWRRPSTMAHLNEWGLGGRSLGSWITWFLIGGDLYTAYTLVAGPAALIIAFAILAAYTYQSGLRAPALIAFVKDALIYLVIIVAVIYIPYKLGGWHKVFDAADAKFKATNGTVLNSANEWYYVTLAFGSALALFLYPHSITGVLASRGRNVIKRNMSALPA